MGKALSDALYHIEMSGFQRYITHMPTQQISTQIVKVNSLPTLKQIQSAELQSIVIFDQILLKKASLKKWLSCFSYAIPVQAGEKLKTLEQYAKVLGQVQKWQQSGLISKKIQFVAVGGGSVGDFVGFIASTYQRGCSLVHIPSTWLSAIDSAHGGKTGLNLNRIKNQIGTFYCADRVILSKSLLVAQPQERLIEAFGEIIKICLINQPHLLHKLKFTEAFVWANLEKFIAGKLTVVAQDPTEKTGARQILNLGHTMGHVYESVLGLSHGRSVLMGLIFAARWSYHLGYLKQKELALLLDLIMSLPECEKDLAAINKLPIAKMRKVLQQDKKSVVAKNHKTLRFIFIVKPGLIFAANQTVENILLEFDRQRFLA